MASTNPSVVTAPVVSTQAQAMQCSQDAALKQAASAPVHCACTFTPWGPLWMPALLQTVYAACLQRYSRYTSAWTVK